MFQEIEKEIPISTQKYKDGGVTEKSVLYFTIKIRKQKNGMTTTEVKNFVVTFFANLRGLNIENIKKKYIITSKLR